MIDTWFGKRINIAGNIGESFIYLYSFPGDDILALTNVIIRVVAVGPLMSAEEVHALGK